MMLTTNQFLRIVLLGVIWGGFLLMNIAYTQVKVPISGGQVKVYRNIRYALKPEIAQIDTSSDSMLDIYIPTASSKKRLPVILFIHGGGFKVGDKSQTATVCKKFANNGYAVVSINYRLALKGSKSKVSGRGLTDKGGVFHQEYSDAIKLAVEDTEASLTWLKKNGKAYNLDTRSVVISGGSAGAIAALYTAYASPQKKIKIRAVINMWGRMEDATIIRSGAPPLLTFHGSNDDTIPVRFAYELRDRMNNIGNTESETYIIQGKGHAIYNIIINEEMEKIVSFLNRVLNK